MGCVSSVDEPDVEGVEWRVVQHDKLPTDNKILLDNLPKQNGNMAKEKGVEIHRAKKQRRKKSSMIISTEIDDLCRHLDTNLINKIDSDCLITSQDFYNLLNDGGLQCHLYNPNHTVLIDIRDQELYETEHVVTATHSSVANSNKFESMLSGFNLIIVYGLGIYDDITLSDAIEYKNELTSKGVCDINFLVDSYKSFRMLFPFMCTEYPIHTMWERRALQIYPSVVIFNRLYQGKGEQASSKLVIENLNISHIINIGSEHPCVFQDQILYLHIDDVNDDPTNNIGRYFDQTTAFIQNAMDTNGCILIHCNMGISRSSAVTLAYLMKSKQWTLGISLEYLRSRRSCSAPNAGFLDQLGDWEQKLFGSRVTNNERLSSSLQPNDHLV